MRSKRRGNGGRKVTLKAEEAAAPDGSTFGFRPVSLPSPSLSAWRADGSETEGGRLRSFWILLQTARKVPPLVRLKRRRIFGFF